MTFHIVSVTVSVKSVSVKRSVYYCSASSVVLHSFFNKIVTKKNEDCKSSKKSGHHFTGMVFCLSADKYSRQVYLKTSIPDLEYC